MTRPSDTLTRVTLRGKMVEFQRLIHDRGCQKPGLISCGGLTFLALIAGERKGALGTGRAHSGSKPQTASAGLQQPASRPNCTFGAYVLFWVQRHDRRIYLIYLTYKNVVSYTMQ